MTAQRPFENESIDALIEAAKRLLRQLEEVKSAGAHDKRAHGRPRPRRASSTQSISKSDLAATFKAIVEKARSELAKLGEPETNEQDIQEQETQAQETQAQETQVQETQAQDTQEQDTQEPELLVLSSHGQVGDQISVERWLSECRTEDSNLRFPCMHSQLGKNMVATIQQAREKLNRHNVNERGYLILEVQKYWDVSELTQLLRAAEALDRDEIKGFTLSQGDVDCLHAHVAAEISLDLCDIEGFNDACVSHQPKEEFEEWIARPPDRVQYLICKPLSDHSINSLLDAGPQCNRRPEIPGVNRPYWYVSCEPNTPATLHIEDGNTGSANLLLAGAEKHWIIVHRSSAEKLEHCIRNQFPGSKECSQFVRHHNVIVGPRWLEEKGIDYEIVCQKPGDVLVTLPGRIYHEVRNVGKNFAAAINYELTDAPEDPTDYIWCERGERKCGRNVLTRQSFMPDFAGRSMDTEDGTPLTNKRKQQKQQEVGTVRKKCKSQATLARRPVNNRLVQTSRPSCTPIPDMVPVPFQERLLEAVLSPTSLHNCISLIQAWRSQLTRIELAPAASDKIAKLAASDTRIRLAQHRTRLDALHLKSAQYAFADEMNSKRQGAIRLDSSVFDQVLEAQGFTSTTKKDREQLRRRVKCATKIYQICQGFGRGLLCLLPLTDMPENHYYSMKNDSIEAFQRLAIEKRTLLEARCQIGVFIQDMFMEDVEFTFEYENVTSFDRLSEAEMLALLQPVSYPKVNLYMPDNSWPKPLSWLWEWPQDPTWAPLSACETCSLVECICLSSLHQNRHRIVDYGLKGRGVQARAALSGGLAFTRGDYIQELVGEVKPLDWPTGSYKSVDFERPDVGMVCRLYCEEKSNWPRLVNHACDPCAELIVKITPGRARMMLCARRDIWDGMEITVDYGKNFSADEKYLCATCSKSATSTDTVEQATS
ncbi:transcription factor jumonji [Pyrenophora seminiperda CCB06]|uniref:Transcription factor jumonji n=1 Tax=Pyrenophora seminiperda CCB06 TaxID=1302712 RepID=A0A3M7MI49_9PLEO|nr:transcription factor jumonji [Pyrenophora seminiperda CCB06]